MKSRLHSRRQSIFSATLSDVTAIDFDLVLKRGGLNLPKLMSIPLSIKPKTKPYTLEILYWGIRNIEESHFMNLGQQKISLDIEIGDRRLEAIDLDRVSRNENFQTHLTHRKYKIEIPEEDEYKPHLSIRCECYGSVFLYNRLHKKLETLEKQISKRILIGTCTIKSIGDYCYSNDELARYCKSSKWNLF